MVYTFTFTQGFILGQLTVVLLIGAFIKFFVFGELPPQESSSSRLSSTTPSSPSKQRRRSLTSTTSSIHHRPRRRAVSFTSPASPSPSPSPSRRNSDSDSSIHARPRSRNRTSIHHILRPPPALTSDTILSKTYYNVSSHQSESLDWFNVLIAQTIAQFRADAARDNAILTSLTRVLNGVHKPSFLDEIRVTEIELGEYFPIFSNCRIVPVFDDDEDELPIDKKKPRKKGRLQAQMDVDISDFITLGVETMMVLNYPRPRTAVLPVALSVSVVRFSGTLAISFSPATSTSSTTESGTQSRRTPTSLAFSFLPDYTLALSTRSLVGARSRLQDIPKIAQLVESRLRMWFEERCVLPRRQEVVVPSLWPSMKNVVDGEGKKPGQTPLMGAVADSEVETVPSEFRHELDGPPEVRWRGGSEKKRDATTTATASASGMLPPLPGSLVT